MGLRGVLRRGTVSANWESPKLGHADDPAWKWKKDEPSWRSTRMAPAGEEQLASQPLAGGQRGLPD